MEHKPPLGVKPRAIHDQERLSDLFEAVLRYMTDARTIPQEWVDEMNDIILHYQGDKENGKKQ